MGNELKSNMHTSKLDKFTVLDIVFKLDKIKSKTSWLLKQFQCFALQYTFFALSGA